MFLLIDTADIEHIRRAVEAYPLDGVTTCPTIILKERRPMADILRDIRAIIGPERMLHAQVLGGTKDEIVADAIALRKLDGGNFYVKIPVTLEGFKAMGVLRTMGIPFTATTIHSVAQAFLAAEQGASFLAPYINHVEDSGVSGAEWVRQVVAFLEARRLPAKILAASFRNQRQITDVIVAGAHTVTLSPDLFWKLSEHPMTDAAVAKFRNAWTTVFGADKNVAELLQ